MKRIVSLAAITATLLGASGIAVAAQTPGGAAPAASVATAPANTAEKADTPEAKTAAKERVIGDFGAWTVICVEGGEPQSCIARQSVELAEKGDGPKLHLFAERQSAEAPVVLTVGAPLGVSLQPGASLLLNEGDNARVWYAPFETCLQEMCLAAAPLNTDMLAQAKTPFVSLALPNNEVIGVQVSLNTLNEAVEALMAEKAKFPVPAAEAPAAEAPAGEEPAVPAEAAPAEAPAAE